MLKWFFLRNKTDLKIILSSGALWTLKGWETLHLHLKTHTHSLSHTPSSFLHKQISFKCFSLISLKHPHLNLLFLKHSSKFTQFSFSSSPLLPFSCWLLFFFLFHIILPFTFAQNYPLVLAFVEWVNIWKVWEIISATYFFTQLPLCSFLPRLNGYIGHF